MSLRPKARTLRPGQGPKRNACKTTVSEGEEEPGKEHTNKTKKNPQRLILLLNFAAPNQNKVLASKTEQ